MKALELSEIAHSEGLDLGFSRWWVIDQDRINRFADATEDRQWIHLDHDRARSGPYGARIAHGFLTLSLVSAALEDLVTVRGATSTVNYGVDRVRFPAPVVAGQSIRAKGQIAAVRPVPGGHQVTLHLEMQSSGSDKPVCVADVLVRFLGEAA